METMGRKDFIKMATTAGVAAVAGAGLSASALADEVVASDVETRLAALEERLWDCEARERIRYKLSLYPRGLDRQDTKIGNRIFTEDSYIDYGTAPDGSWQWQGTGPEWIDYCTNVIDKGITAMGGYYAHEIFQVCITVNGTKAGSEYYGTAWTMLPQENGLYRLASSVARYNDKWEYRDGDWYIVERIVTNDFGWSHNDVPLREPYGCAFDETDPSYGALAYGAGE